ncbi:MAG: GDSL family lipase [Nocardioides sp.]|nr:GDSL family lipase [Nocardioides sp.]
MVRSLGAVLPGVRRVLAQAEPYADAWHAHNRRVLAAPSGRRRWVVLGDSMSQSVGAGGHDRGWVGQLDERLAASGVHLEVLNLSATGARVDDVLDQQLPALRGLPASTADAPDLVTVLVGSNDLFAGRRVRDALPERFGALVDALPRGAVVATLPQPRAAARGANRHVDEAGARGALRVVDMRTDGPDTWVGRVAEDRFHPNERGYAAIADAFEPVVRRALG